MVSPPLKRSAENLYDKYSIKGAYPKTRKGNSPQKKSGNFITYVNRAKYVFGENEAIDSSTKNHMLKIKRKLGS